MNNWVVPVPDTGITWRWVRDGWQEESDYFGCVRFEKSLRPPRGDLKEAARGTLQELGAAVANISHLQRSVPFSPFPLPPRLPPEPA